MWPGEGDNSCSTVGSTGEGRAVGQAGWEPSCGEEPALALSSLPAPCFPLQVHCISTEFTPRKHGGEKGVPFRVQIDTFKQNENGEYTEHLHSASCQIKVFKVGRPHHARRQSALPCLPSGTETFPQLHVEAWQGAGHPCSQALSVLSALACWACRCGTLLSFHCHACQCTCLLWKNDWSSTF